MNGVGSMAMGMGVRAFSEEEKGSNLSEVETHMISSVLHELNLEQTSYGFATIPLLSPSHCFHHPILNNNNIKLIVSVFA